MLLGQGLGGLRGGTLILFFFAFFAEPGCVVVLWCWVLDVWMFADYLG